MAHRTLLNAVILASTGFLAAQQPSATPPSNTTERTTNGTAPAHTLLDGTPVKLRLAETISSSDARVGQEVAFETVEEVTVDGIAVLPKGASAIATVTEAEHKKSMGRAGKLNVSISFARLADSEKVALRAVKESKGGGHVGAVTGAVVATSIVFFPAAPLFLFVHGKDITIPQGTEITAFIDGDMHLNMANFGAAPPTPPAAPKAVNAELVIESAPAGADIELDGAFVGSTPSTLTVPAGAHEIVVRKKGLAPWSRKMNVTGGTVRLNAELEPVRQSAQ